MHPFAKLICTVLVSGIAVIGAMLVTTEHAAAQTGSTWIELDTFGGPDCDPALHIKNVGSEPSKAAIVFFDERDTAGALAGPHKVECSGLITPDATWSFMPSILPAGMERAVVVSFTVKQLSEIGVDLGFDDVVADYMCESLFFGVVGDRDDYDRFASAVAAGTEFAGVPMDRAAGAPMTATVDVTDCGATAVVVSPSVARSVPAVAVDSALANPASISGHGQLQDPGKPASPFNSYRTCLVLQNANVPWHPLHNSLVFRAACQ